MADGIEMTENAMEKEKLEELLEGEIPESIVYKRIGGRELRLYICRPEGGDGKNPAVLCIHGGGWHSETPARMFPHIRYFASEGYTGIAAEYRLKTEETTAEVCLEDCVDALKYLRKNADKLNIDETRITAMGDSAGGYLACCLGTKNILSRFEGSPCPVAKVVDLNGIVDLTGHWGYGLSDGGEMRNGEAYLAFYRKAQSLSPVWQVSSGDAPVLAVHGLADSIVEVRDSVRYCDTLKECGVSAELLLLEGLEHAFILFDYNNANADVYRILKRLRRFLA